MGFLKSTHFFIQSLFIHLLSQMGKACRKSVVPWVAQGEESTSPCQVGDRLWDRRCAANSQQALGNLLIPYFYSAVSLWRLWWDRSTRMGPGLCKWPSQKWAQLSDPWLLREREEGCAGLRQPGRNTWHGIAASTTGLPRAVGGLSKPVSQWALWDGILLETFSFYNENLND